MQSRITGSFLHDMGKVGIPDTILRMPARLSADESETMRTHIAQGDGSRPAECAGSIQLSLSRSIGLINDVGEEYAPIR